MSVNRYDPATDTLIPVSGTYNHLKDEMVAEYESTNTATHAYEVGGQFIYNGRLYEVTSAISVGDTIITEGANANCIESDSLTEQIKDINNRPILNPKGTCVFADLPTIVASHTGDMWNIEDDFTTTSDFREGAGIKVKAGANVYLTSDGKWDVMAVGGGDAGEVISYAEWQQLTPEEQASGDYYIPDYNGSLPPGGFDAMPTQGSNNPVTSNGIYEALQNAGNNIGLYIDETTGLIYQRWEVN